MHVKDYDGVYRLSLTTDGESSNTTYGDGTTSGDIEIKDGYVQGVDSHGSYWSGNLVSVDERHVEMTLMMDPSNAGKEILSMQANGELTNSSQTVTHVFNVKQADGKVMLSCCFDHGGVSVFITLIRA